MTWVYRAIGQTFGSARRSSFRFFTAAEKESGGGRVCGGGQDARTLPVYDVRSKTLPSSLPDSLV